MILNLGELTEEQVKAIQKDINTPAEKEFSKNEMEIWPDDIEDIEELFEEPGE